MKNKSLNLFALKAFLISLAVLFCTFILVAHAEAPNEEKPTEKVRIHLPAELEQDPGVLSLEEVQEKKREDAYEEQQKEKARIAAEKAEAERKAREEAERVERERQQQIAAEKAAAEAKAAEQAKAKASAEAKAKAKAERDAKIKAETERKALEAKKAEAARTANANTARRNQAQVAENGTTYQATYYTADCKGCSGITKLGYDVRGTIYHNGMRVIAVDPSRIPLGSVVQVTTPYESFKAVAGDTGGDIKGGRIDILVADRATAYRLGRHDVTVTILK